jgi:hypothetical protein
VNVPALTQVQEKSISSTSCPTNSHHLSTTPLSISVLDIAVTELPETTLTTFQGTLAAPLTPPPLMFVLFAPPRAGTLTRCAENKAQ